MAGTGAALVTATAPATAKTNDADLYWQAQAIISDLEDHRADYPLNQTADDTLDLLLAIRQ